MRRLSILLPLVAAVGLMACPSLPPDTDDLPSKPDLPRLPPDLEVADSLDVNKHDKVDWKAVTAFDGGTATLSVVVGDPFGDAHGVTGEVGVYPTSGPPAIDKTAITPTEHSYELEFEVEEGADYLVQVSASKGAAPYKITFGVEAAPADPCAEVECGDGQECKGGECVDVVDPNVCDPPCSRGRVCVEGTCERPCGGRCPRGQYCSRKTNACAKDPCYKKKCGAGEKCRYGKCVKVVKKGCDPACGAGFKCVGTKCVEQASDEPAVASGPIKGKIVQLISQGNKTVLVLNRGKKVGVKRGATGKISGVAGTFKITEVYTFRAKAVIPVEDKVIGSNRSVTINR